MSTYSRSETTSRIQVASQQHHTIDSATFTRPEPANRILVYGGRPQHHRIDNASSPRSEPVIRIPADRPQSRQVENPFLLLKRLEEQVQQLNNMIYCLEIPGLIQLSENYNAAVTQYSQTIPRFSSDFIQYNLRLIQGAANRHRATHRQIMM